MFEVHADSDFDGLGTKIAMSEVTAGRCVGSTCEYMYSLYDFLWHREWSPGLGADTLSCVETQEEISGGCILHRSKGDGANFAGAHGVIRVIVYLSI